MLNVNIQLFLGDLILEIEVYLYISKIIEVISNMILNFNSSGILHKIAEHYFLIRIECADEIFIWEFLKRFLDKF